MAIDTARARAQLRPKVIPSSLVSEPIVKDVSAPPRRRFEVILVKPSHYDDDGYVIQWFMSVVPSNSLAALYGLARDAEARRVLGDDVEINVTAIDETNTRIRPRKLIRSSMWIRSNSSRVRVKGPAESISLSRKVPTMSTGILEIARAM